MTRSERLEEIRKRAEAAADESRRWHETMSPGSALYLFRTEVFGRSGEAVLRNAREDIPWLLSEVERLDAALFEALQAHARTLNKALP